MKKILIFGMTDVYGGVESFLANYCRNMNSDEVQFDIISYFNKVAYGDEFINHGGKIIKVTSKRENMVRNKTELKNFFKEHAHEYEALWCNLCEITNIDVLKYAKKYGISKIIIHSHNNRSTRKGLPVLMHKYYRTQISKYATDYWACSDLAGEWFFNKELLNSDKFKIINNAVDVDKFAFSTTVRDSKRKELGVENKLVIGNVGRLHFQKNQDFLIDIFECIYKKNPDSELVLIGTGEDEEKIKSKIEKLNLEKNVKLLGRREDISDLMQAMDIFVLPSLFEGLGIVLIEAQAAGLKSFTSESVVPKAAQVTELLEYISLNKSPEYWADKILQCANYERKNMSVDIRNKGYDIKQEAKKIQNLLLQ